MWNFDPTGNVLSRFGRRVRSTPDALAVESFDGRLTYRQLDERAEQVCGALRDSGVGADSVVGVMLPRSAELVVALVGVLKAGAAYMAMDVAQPPRRLARMLSISGASRVLTNTVHGANPALAASASVERILLDSATVLSRTDVARPVTIGPDDLAYVVFTSGSTGSPKGVMVGHAAFEDLIGWYRVESGITEHDRLSMIASIGFDAVTVEIWPGLASGASLHVVDETVRLNPPRLRDWLCDNAITVASMPTPLADALSDLEWRPGASLRVMHTGGDRLVRRPAAATPYTLINGYGPSEATVAVTAGVVTPSGRGSGLPSIGHPLPGVVHYILDEELRPVPDGEPGEFYVGGVGLARGYINRPDLTADRFVPDPFSTQGGRRLYRTGDLVRRRADGKLEFLDRNDTQTQVRGHRVEPAEVAAALLAHPDLAHAYVQALAHPGDGGSRLVAHIVPRDPHRIPTVKALRERLRGDLPEYMVPSVFVVVDALPLSPNGKVDRQRLREVDLGERQTGDDYQEPRTALESRLARIWRDVLRVDRVGVTDDLFDVGGHSLTATIIAARIQDGEGVEITVAEVLSTTTVERLAELVERRRGASPTLPVLRAGGKTRAPLSRQQEQVWFLGKLNPDSIAYQSQTTIRMVGELDLDALDAAVTELTRRHAILRTTYREDDSGRWQVVHPPEPVRVRRVDLTGLPPETRAARGEELVAAEMSRRFDLGCLPMQRWTSIRLAPDEHELVLVEHHMVHDGWSFTLMMRELKTLYAAHLGGTAEVLPELPAQYADFATWQHDDLAEGGKLSEQLDFWRRRLDGLGEPLTVRPDHPRPVVSANRGNTLRFELPAALPPLVRDFCRGQRVTLFSTMFAAFNALLHRYTSVEDLCVASAFANRRIPGAQAMIGMFVNPVPLRQRVSADMRFDELVRQSAEGLAEAAAYQEFPFPELVRALNPGRDISGQPLTQIMFSAHDSALPDLDFGAASGTVFERGNGSAKMDIDVVVLPRAESQTRDAARTDERITMMWEYNTELYDETTMRRMADRYVQLLQAAIAAPDTPIGSLPLLSPSERHRVLTEWNPPADSRPIAVHHQVLAHAARRPDSPAVAADGSILTYGDLAGRAAALARTLRDKGIGPGDVVGVLLPRCARLPIAQLGVMLAGAAFLPIDVDSPPERVAFQCDDAPVSTVVTTPRWAAGLPSTVDVVNADGPSGAAPPAGVAVATDDPAYVIYTSGSTGRPKGVVVGHASLANLAEWHRERFGLSPSDRVSMVASPAFDVSVGEIWPALAAGACLAVPADDVRLSPPRLRDWLGEQEITVTDLPVALVESLLELPWGAETPLRFMLTGGDRLTKRPPGTVPFAVVNAYGPTEATVTATSGTVRPDGAAAPSIGRPINGAACYVLDAELNPVPPGVTGELYLGGRGVALRYLGRPDLTADRFVPDPFSAAEGRRMYRTGDLVRHLPDGRLEFLGRNDSQIKVRGHRIEPAEIEAALRAHCGAGSAHIALRPRDGGGDWLVGYLVSADGPRPDAPQLRERLAPRLPGYMIPQAFVWLDALPLNRNGKVDAARLPAPSRQAAPGGASSPAGDLERELARLWREVLNVEDVGVGDNFFDLGGHSLLLGHVHHRITTELGRELPMVALFQHTTIRALATHLSEADTRATAASGAPARRVGAARLNRGRRRSFRRDSE